MFNEKMKLFMDLSAAHCFLAELHAMGVQPPITFPNSVSTRVRVPLKPSHFLWNYLIENAFSDALNTNLKEAIFVSKSRWMTATSFAILLGSISGATFDSKTAVGLAILSLADPGFRYISLALSSNSLSSSCRTTTSFSTILGIQTLLAACISPSIVLIQLPLICVKLFSVRFFMNFITSIPKPQVLTHIRNLACSVLTFDINCRNSPSNLSLRQWNSGDRRLGLSQIIDQTSSQRTLEQFQWNKLHSSRLQKPASQIIPGLRQSGLVQTAKAVCPQTHSGPWVFLSVIFHFFQEIYIYHVLIQIFVKAVNLSVMVVFDQWKEWLINKLKQSK